MQNPEIARRVIFGVVAATGLFLVYVLQRVDYLSVVLHVVGFVSPSAMTSFIFNRTVRLVTNDLLCLVLIQVLFQDHQFSRVAFLVFLVELFVILPLYLMIKLGIEGPSEISSPLLQPVHRMIVNPLLMVILIAAFYYQRWQEKRSANG